MTGLFELLYRLHRKWNVPVCTEEELYAMICKHIHSVPYVLPTTGTDHNGERIMMLCPKGEFGLVFNSFRPKITIYLQTIHTGVLDVCCEVPKETQRFLKIFFFICTALEIMLFLSFFLPQPQIKAFLMLVTMHILYLGLSSLMFRVSVKRVLTELTD